MKLSWRWLAIVLLSLALTACMASPGDRGQTAKVPISVFILAGQSNMQGQTGDATAYPADPSGLDRSILFHWAIPRAGQSSQGWTTLGPQAGLFPSGHFGPEIRFARRLSQASEQSIAIFKFSLGGTGLALDWRRPGEGGLYDQLVQQYTKALEQLRQQGKQPIPQAFIWIQGESDAETPELSAQYRARLQLLIEDVRQNLVGDAELPIILGLDEQHPWVVRNPEVVRVQAAIAAADPYIIRTSMVGLEKADATHLTPAGLVAHGDRLASAWLELLQAKSGKTLMDQ